ncbi:MULTISPECIES: twin transmembrane helix small protein [unclassified Xanthobacter]|uniref:twin transmembrane helix small protein n=1 Tax=unclassified Xanthobacter TaxID=2623496 RepID=UPI001EDFC531|nr:MULTISPECIES: twin transmembrane helix small protein [unclassified Xanthobacter]
MLHWSITLFIPLALALVAGVLLLGLFNFAAGGSPQRSQLLMRLRIIFQLLAVLLVAATVFAMYR